jgi:hypothetical protein
MPEAELNLVGEVRRTVGRVNALDPSLVTIATPTGQTQQISTTDETVVMTAAVGALRDVRAGSRVVVKNQPGLPNEALEVVVLPATSLHGVPVVADTPDSITIRHLLGNLVTVNTAEARVDKATSGTINDMTIGSTIFVRGRIVGAGNLAAEEIIVLPDGTTFGT